MVHRDPTFAGRTRRQCASPTAGINGRGCPSRANRVREYRKPSTGSRFRKTERNGTSDGAWLGAGRFRMVCQMLTEALVLSFIAGVAGVLPGKLPLRPPSPIWMSFGVL